MCNPKERRKLARGLDMKKEEYLEDIYTGEKIMLKRILWKP
jgi:hypothetical protein